MEFTPEYQAQRAARATQWVTPSVSQKAGPTSEDEEADPEVIGPEAVMREKTGTRWAQLCDSHRRPLCKHCRKLTRPRLTPCCASHHKATDPPMVDYCEEHRMGICGGCKKAQRGAAYCCKWGHHVCEQHARGRCEGCATLPLRERRPQMCCEKGHHAGDVGKRRSATTEGKPRKKARTGNGEQGPIPHGQRRRGRGSPEAFQE